MARLMSRIGLLFAAAATAGCSLLTPLPKPSTLKARLAEFPSTGLSLDRPAVVRWNAHHVPFVEAETDDDAAFVLGLVHAHLRLGQIAMARMIARGRLSEIAGPIAADVDRGLRTLAFDRAAEEIVERMDPTARRWLQRFVDGLNRYQDGMRELPHEFRVAGLGREPWRAEDVVAIGRLAGTDVNWMVWAGLLPLRDRPDWPELWSRLVAHGTGPTPETAGDGPSADVERVLGNHARYGSNSMALAASRTDTGGALIANDPHLGIIVPNFWLIAGLKSPSYHVVGLMGPGVPAFAIGRTPHIAWGGTHMRAAMSDLVDVGSLDEDRFAERRERIGVRWWIDDEAVVRESPYGPVVSDLPFLAGLGLPPAALRWIGHQSSDEIGAMLAVSRARNFDEFRAAFRDFAVPGQNMLYADRDGNIGKVMAVRVPERKAPPADLVVDPAASDEAWRKILGASDLPHSLNPERGFVVSANDRPAGPGQTVGWFFSPGDRVERMTQLIESGPASVEDLKAWQRDVFMISSVRLRDALLPLLDRFGVGADTPEGQRVLQRLRDWDGHYRAASVEAVSFEQFRTAFVRAFYAARYGEEDGARFAGGRLSQFLLEDMERAEESVLRDSLAAGLDAAVAGLDRFENWGAMHRLSLAHPLANAPVIGRRYRFGEYGVGGSTDTLMKTSHDRTGERHSVGYGANARHVSDMRDPDANFFVLLGGQDGWLNSSTMLDQWPLWQEGRYLQLPLSQDAVRDAFPYRTELRP